MAFDMRRAGGVCKGAARGQMQPGLGHLGNLRALLLDRNGAFLEDKQAAGLGTIGDHRLARLIGDGRKAGETILEGRLVRNNKHCKLPMVVAAQCGGHGHKMDLLRARGTMAPRSPPFHSQISDQIGTRPMHRQSANDRPFTGELAVG
jgi:hypothetical protein